MILSQKEGKSNSGMVLLSYSTSSEQLNMLQSQGIKSSTSKAQFPSNESCQPILLPMSRNETSNTDDPQEPKVSQNDGKDKTIFDSKSPQQLVPLPQSKEQNNSSSKSQSTSTDPHEPNLLIPSRNETASTVSHQDLKSPWNEDKESPPMALISDSKSSHWPQVPQISRQNRSTSTSPCVSNDRHQPNLLSTIRYELPSAHGPNRLKTLRNQGKETSTMEMISNPENPRTFYSFESYYWSYLYFQVCTCIWSIQNACDHSRAYVLTLLLQYTVDSVTCC